MSVSKQDVQKVAKLSRLTFTPEELTQVQNNMNDILSYMEQLKTVDTSSVDDIPRGQGQMRVDQPQPSIPVDEILKNAPKTSGTCIVVPKVLE